jgi:hypothetical protein
MLNLSTYHTKMFKLHFADSDYETVTCRDCIDYQLRQCDGKGYVGYECVQCIREHATIAHEGAHRQ